MNSKTQSSRATARPTLLDSTAARLGAALGLVGIGGALLLVSAVGDSGQSGMLPGIGLIFALLAALLLSLWINDRNNRRLIELFERISRDPDAALDLPLEQHATTDECRRMIDSYARLMAHMQASQQRLRDSETRFRTMFEQSPYALQLFTPDGEHLHANRAFLELWGFALVEQINGFNILRDQQLAAAGLLPYIQRGFAGETTTVPAMRYDPAQVPSIRDGRPRWVQSVVYPIKDAAGTTREVAVVFEDITERVQAYETLEQGVAERTHELSTLLEVSHNVASTLELKPLLGLILDQLQKVVDYTAATIYIVENDRLVVQDYRRPIAENTVVPFSYPLDRIGMLWEALRAGEPVIIADTRADTPLARFYQSIMGQQLYAELSYIRSWMGVPLLLKERVIGVLVVSHNVPDHFTPRHGRLALAIANQAAVAIENAKLFEQAQGLAALMERQRLARELHDSVSQALYGIALGARTARTLLDRDPSRLAEPLDYVLSLAEAGLTEMRALIFELRPESLELEGLVVALTKQAASIRARHNIDVQSTLCAEPEIPIEQKEALYRIAQEALHNIVKHAHATHVELELAADRDRLALTVRDNGRGFDPAQSFPGHLGLRSMHERAARLGGTLDVTSTPGSGTSIRARMPAQRATERS